MMILTSYGCCDLTIVSLGTRIVSEVIFKKKLNGKKRNGYKNYLWYGFLNVIMLILVIILVGQSFIQTLPRILKTQREEKWSINV